MTISKLPGAQFPPGSVYPHGRMPGSGPVLKNAPGIIQIGYDQNINGVTMPPPAGDFGFVPRDNAGNPLKVILPGVVPGNFLEVDWRACLEVELDEYYPTVPEFFAQAVVTFDGTDPSLGAFLIIVNTAAGFELEDTAGDEDDAKFCVGQLAAVEIPAGATIATVELIYQSTINASASGTNAETADTSMSLKASEISSALVTQPGPTLLLPFP